MFGGKKWPEMGQKWPKTIWRETEEGETEEFGVRGGKLGGRRLHTALSLYHALTDSF